MSVSPAGRTSRLGRRLAAAHYYRTYSPTRLQVGSKISMHPLPLRVRKQLVLASSSTLEIARRARFPHVTAAFRQILAVLRDLRWWSSRSYMP